MKHWMAVALALALATSALAHPRCAENVTAARVPWGFWTDEKVLDAIVYLYDYRATVSLSQTAVSTGHDRQLDRLLETFFEVPVTGKKLFAEAKRRFGSWSAAIEAAGYDYLDYVDDPDAVLHGFWSRERVLKGIRYLYRHRDEVRLLSEAISVDESDHTAELLASALGRKVTGSRLHSAARRFFGSWSQAYEASWKGRRYADLQEYYGLQFFTHERITKLLRVFHRVGISLSPGDIQRDDSMRTSTAMLMFGGRWSTGMTLYAMACRRFGSWENALRSAKIDPNRYFKYVAWSKPLIIRLLKDLRRSKVALNVGTFQNDSSPRTLRILEKHAKKPISAAAFLRAAASWFGSWDAALHAAGIDPSEVRKYLSRRHRELPPHQVEPYRGHRAREDEAPYRTLIGRPEPLPVEEAMRREFWERVDALVVRLEPKLRSAAPVLIEIVLSSEDGISPSVLTQKMKDEGVRWVTPKDVDTILRKLQTIEDLAA